MLDARLLDLNFDVKNIDQERPGVRLPRDDRVTRSGWRKIQLQQPLSETLINEEAAPTVLAAMSSVKWRYHLFVRLASKVELGGCQNARGSECPESSFYSSCLDSAAPTHAPINHNCITALYQGNRVGSVCFSGVAKMQI